MTRLEYEKYILDQKIDINKLDIAIGEKKVVPYITGCFQENVIWKIYMVGERHDFDIVQEGNEEEIFEAMYSITESRKKCLGN